MIQINQIKLPCGADGGPASQTHPQLEAKIHKAIHIPKGQQILYQILRHSVDARKKPTLYDIYSVGIYLPSRKIHADSPWMVMPYTGREEYALEEQLVRKAKDHNVLFRRPVHYRFPQTPEMAPRMMHRPIVVGAGPAGLFCALELAEAGYQPIVIERGKAMQERIADVEAFWAGGPLQPDSNIQFGEGGAGTFSDGKLNSSVSDKSGRTEEVIRRFMDAGAPSDIAYEYHPHVGTDILRSVVVHLREQLIACGGAVRFETTLTGLQIENGHIVGAQVTHDGAVESIPTEIVVLAIGHSARDTFRMLQEIRVPMEVKSFAIGMRLSHPQRLIDQQQYGVSDPKEMQRLHLSPSSYKLVAQNPDGRAVYSFCMCPGGYVVNASSEAGRLCVNGMSDYARDAARANSAIVVTVGPEDYGGSEPLDGLVFQERLEEQAYRLAGGQIPVQRYVDYRDGVVTEGEADAEALCIKGASRYAALHTLLPEAIRENLITGMERFNHMIPGYAGEEAYCIGLESRTSSPVRIPRDGSMQCVNVEGLIPCGEGPGYAGGIMSAAIDGIKAAEAVALLYKVY